MPFIGVADPNEGRHVCAKPSTFLRRHWALWQCLACRQVWRIEPADYGEMDGWHFHPYEKEY
jgi:hypothetical protein